jgi:single-stranded-DNA-specific exonuclease
MAASLLATDDPAEAHRLARQLDALNADRREVEQAVVEAAARQVAGQAAADRRVLLAVGEGWHPGVLGIVAGRLAERFHRPVLVGADRGGTVVGSARAPVGFDLGAALHRALDAGLALKAGGHARAGGFTVERQRLEAFHDAVEALATAPTAPELRLDGSVAVAGCSARLVAAMARLEPYGEGHPVPRLRVLGGRLGGTRIVGERHLKLWLRSDDGATLDAIAFRAEGTALWDRLPNAVDRPLQLAGKLEADRYRGGDRAQLLVDDVALDEP